MDCSTPDQGRASSPLVVHNQENYHITDIVRSAGTVDDVSIWGGNSYNCAEDATSKLVQANCENLRRFIFLPQRHKGGRMVRPWYTLSSRSASCIFPSIKVLGYYEDCGTPLDALWIVPQLETLYVFQGHYNDNKKMLDRWKAEPMDTDPSTAQSLPLRVLGESPNLQEIIVAKPDFSKPFHFQVIRRIVRRPLIWQGLRWMQVVIERENPETCPLAVLPLSLIDCIIAFCPNEIFDSQDFSNIGIEDAHETRDESTQDSNPKTRGKEGQHCTSTSFTCRKTCVVQ